MAVRILHCSDNLNNFKICIEHKVAGFPHLGQNINDLIYLVVKINKKAYCGARFRLHEISDEKPWEDADRYVVSYSVDNIEFCQPFPISFLKDIGGQYWSLKYLQASKDIEINAAKLLDSHFSKNKINSYPDFTKLADSIEDKCNRSNTDNEETIYDPEKDQELTQEESKDIQETVQNKIDIMGTFQTINFTNETDPFMGIEKLVTDNFYELFHQYKEENTILISKNRLFRTHQMNSQVPGVSAIPDALLITFWPEKKEQLQISLVEYECYGENKVSPTIKSKYLNSHIIPQLMQFASSFSIITDPATRQNTINDWINKICEQIDNDNELTSKVDSWMRISCPSIKERDITRQFEKMLEKAFSLAIHVFLIIDDLSTEQKETIKNIISSFKLESGSEIIFDSAIVKLVQKIRLVNSSYDYALTVQ